jgi:hypothetical protein
LYTCAPDGGDSNRSSDTTAGSSTTASDGHLVDVNAGGILDGGDVISAHATSYAAFDHGILLDLTIGSAEAVNDNLLNIEAGSGSGSNNGNLLDVEVGAAQTGNDALASVVVGRDAGSGDAGHLIDVGVDAGVIQGDGVAVSADVLGDGSGAEAHGALIAAKFLSGVLTGADAAPDSSPQSGEGDDLLAVTIGKQSIGGLPLDVGSHDQGCDCSGPAPLSAIDVGSILDSIDLGDCIAA